MKTRIGQSIFRKMVLDNYDSKCCFSGVDIPQLLVASHIVPWAEREDIRLNPRNGLCLSFLHDRTFDQGFWTLNEQAEIVISDALKSTESNFLQEQFMAYEGKTLASARSHMPEQEFFRFHREHIFKH